MWKAVFNCLSVDEKVRQLGIPLVLACNCRMERKVEGLEHVLGNGEFAVDVWRKVSVEVGFHFLIRQSWKESVQVWFNRFSRLS